MLLIKFIIALYMIVVKYIGIGLLISVLFLVLLLIYFYIEHVKNPQKPTSKSKGLHRNDYLIIATVPENKWTEHNFLRIGIDLIDEPYTYIYTALLINNDTKVYKLNDTWVEKETEQETEYSKFIGMAVDNYLLARKVNATSNETESDVNENSQDKNVNPETPSKNSFLYGADDFGEMKKGVVFNGNTYNYENEKNDAFKIQPALKKRRNKK